MFQGAGGGLRVQPPGPGGHLCHRPRGGGGPDGEAGKIRHQHQLHLPAETGAHAAGIHRGQHEAPGGSGVQHRVPGEVGNTR